jgi:plastocyanin
MPLVLLAALALAEARALAANQAVTVGGSADVYTPASVSLYQGETVTWTNAGGDHNVFFEDGSFNMPNPSSTSLWTVSRTFNTTGTFGYYCAFHGLSMSGTVVVSPAPPGGIPPGGGGGGSPGGPGPPSPPVSDKSAPRLRVELASSQRVVRRALRLIVASDEESTLKVTGTVSVPNASKVFRFRTVTMKLAPRTSTAVRLKLAKVARAAVKRALAKRARLTARLTLSLEDRAGNTRSAKRKVRIRP